MEADTKRWIFDIAAWAAGILVLVLLVNDALADARVTTVANSTWRDECRSCPIPYPPGLLPAQSWRAILRVTQTLWFKREHSDVSVSVREGSKVNALAHCAACHRDAAVGDYGECTLRLPK